MADVTETLSTIELIWIIVALVAAFFSARGLTRWQREDRQRRVDGLNGPLKIFYHGKIRLFSLGLAAFILCLLLGIQSALIPPRTATLHAGYQVIVGRALIVTAPLIVITVIALFAVALILDERDRTLIDRAHDKVAEQRLLSIEAAARHAAVRADVAEARADVAAARADTAFTRADVAEQRADTAFTRADVAFTRADVAEHRADTAFTRADVAEQRADTAAITVEGLTPRVDVAEGELDAHTGEIHVHTEEIVSNTDRIEALEKRDG